MKSARSAAAMLFGAMVMVSSLLANGPSGAMPVTFRKVVDTDTMVPGGTDTFTGFSEDASVRNGRVAFSAAFPDVGPPNFFPGDEGIFREVGGVLTTVADSNTAAPGSTGNFETVARPIIDQNGFVTFPANAPGADDWIFTDAGGLQAVADSSSIPGGGFGAEVDSPFIDSGVVVFTDFGAVWTNEGGSLSTVVDSSTTIPGSSLQFTDIGGRLSTMGSWPSREDRSPCSGDLRSATGFS